MWGLILALLIAIIISGFASLNSAPVSVNFLLWQAPEISLAIVVLLSVLIGVIMAALFGAPRYAKTMRKIKELENKIKSLESGEINSHTKTSSPTRSGVFGVGIKPEEKQLGEIKEEEKHEEEKEQYPPQN